MKKNITVIGLGYVGCSMAVLLAERNNIYAVDIDKNKINKLLNKESPIKDKDISQHLIEKELNLYPSTELESNLHNSDYVIICTPTNFDESKKTFDTSSIKKILKTLNSKNFGGIVVIKSTIPIGFTEAMKQNYPRLDILFSPEFLREGSALYDNLHPSRIVVGGNEGSAKKFSLLLASSAKKKNIDIFIISSSEAESVKLFSNSYLAMRVAFFNELDSFAMANKLNAKNIIDSMSADSRIGSYYNNPSFGYGGYCLPKDTKQLEASFLDTPQMMISATIKSNEVRKQFVSEHIIQQKPKVVGFYKLVMKAGSNNCRDSAIIDVLKILKNEDITIIVFEPLLEEDNKLLKGVLFERNIDTFKKNSDLIITNRFTRELSDIKHKILTRDIFNNN